MTTAFAQSCPILRLPGALTGHVLPCQMAQRKAHRSFRPESRSCRWKHCFLTMWPLVRWSLSSRFFMAMGYETKLHQTHVPSPIVKSCLVTESLICRQSDVDEKCFGRTPHITSHVSYTPDIRRHFFSSCNSSGRAGGPALSRTRKSFQRKCHHRASKFLKLD